MERTYSGDHLLMSTGGAAIADVDISDAVKIRTTVPRRTALPSMILVIGILPGSPPCDREDGSCSTVYPLDRLVRFQNLDCLSTHQIVHCLWEPCVISDRLCINLGGRPLAETDDFKAKPPPGIDAIGASSEGASLYELIREDII